MTWEREMSNGESKRQTKIAGEGMLAAKSAGLRYMDDRRPGIDRRRRGNGFSYVNVDGRPLRSGETLTRIRSLAIPPAWREVWICPDPHGHLQATGRDARGRKQYRYHPRWREIRDGNKYQRMIAFGRALPLIRRRVETDLARHGLSREKILATVVRLLEVTLIRVGNEEYAKSNDSFGLATTRDRHVRITCAYQWVGCAVSISRHERHRPCRRFGRPLPGWDRSSEPGFAGIRTLSISR